MTRILPRFLAFLAAALVGLTGCATATVRGPSVGASTATGASLAWLRTELYMGAVPAEDWKQFLADTVTPKFPAGFTVLDAYGQWRSPAGEIRSLPSRVLVILHPPDAASEEGIEEIRTAFKKRFGHVSVLRATAPASVRF